ncbi:MAG TPA: hypothetical protein VF484_01230, partial [Candidatus Limnocylindrales bacterium]
MLTDRELRDLLRSVDVDQTPDPSFQARLFAGLLDARGATARQARAPWAGLAVLRQRPALIW